MNIFLQQSCHLPTTIMSAKVALKQVCLPTKCFVTVYTKLIY